MKKPNILFIMSDHQLFHRHGKGDYGPKIKRDAYEKLPEKESIYEGLFVKLCVDLLGEVFFPGCIRTIMERF